MARTQINKATRGTSVTQGEEGKAQRELEERRQGLPASGDDGTPSHIWDATVVLIGLPSVGKPTILNQITNAKSKTGAYDFTTDYCTGVMEHRGKITGARPPGIIAGAAQGKGLGKRVLSVARSADLVSSLDVFQPGVSSCSGVKDIGIRPDEKPPNIVIEKTSTGGLRHLPGTSDPKKRPSGATRGRRNPQR
jgi:ribosome-interacting GTPase 1